VDLTSSEKFLALAVAMFTVVIPLWALIDVIRRPTWQWEAADRNKPKWLLFMVVSMVFFFGGIFCGLWYLLRVQPHLRSAQRPVSPGDIYHSTADLPADDPRRKAMEAGERAVRERDAGQR
jgi:hypothetical protein